MTLETDLRINSSIIQLLIILLFLSGCDETHKTSILIEKIPMRDGINLSTDLYFPKNSNKDYPIILIRTPYNKTLLKEYGEFYRTHGFIVAIQDVRGKYNSEGIWNPYESEGLDGYDAIEWLAKQKWSNGKIGMVGGSYSGSVQLAAAIEKPPHLVTIVPNITPATPFNNTPYENGAFALGWAIRWSSLTNKNYSPKIINQKFKDVFIKDWYKELNHLPVIDLDIRICGSEISFWRNWINKELNNEYFTNQHYLDRLNKIKIPVLLQSGWFDVANRGTKLIYQKLKKSQNHNLKMIIGPWTHSDKSIDKIGSKYLGKNTKLDLFNIYLKWFSYWLKNEKNGIMDEPRIQIFNIGPNEWVHSSEYPPKSMNKTCLYIVSSVENNIESQRCVLAFEAPLFKTGKSSYSYDPSDPTPSFGDYMKRNKLSAYQLTMDSRKDVLIYETSPMKDEMVVCGPVKAVLYASTSAIDTDFNITMCGIDKNGNIFPIGQTFGIIRAKYRNSLSKPELLEPNEIYKYEIDLSQTFYTLKAGEKLRVEISSCAFPDFSRNLNTGRNNQTTSDYQIANQVIYHNKNFPSAITFYTKEKIP